MTTLKRNGSDYSATILGALFAAGHITIWTDVDGVYSADPRKVLFSWAVSETLENPGSAYRLTVGQQGYQRDGSNHPNTGFAACKLAAAV